MDKTKSAWHWITALCVALMMFTGTLTSSGFSVMVNAVKEYVGMTGAESSLIFTLKNISALCFVFLTDRYYKKVGLRFGVVGGLLMGALAMTIFMFADKNLIMIYAAAIVAGACYAFAMLLPMALINYNWFNKNRTLAMSIASAGTGLNAMVITPTLQRIVNGQGTAAAFGFEIAMFCIVAVIFGLLVRDTPAERGLEPYGGADYAVATGKGKGSGVVLAKKWTVVFTVCAGIAGFIGGPTQQYAILHFTNLGYDSMMIAGAYGILGGMLIVTKLLFGTLTSKFNLGYVSCIFLGFYVICTATAVSAQFTQATWALYLMMICIGLGGPVISLGYPNWIADTHPKDYAKAAKTAQTAYQAVEILGSFVPGLILDFTGHYTGYYAINCVLYIVVIVLVFSAYRSAKKAPQVKASEVD